MMLAQRYLFSEKNIICAQKIYANTFLRKKVPQYPFFASAFGFSLPGGPSLPEVKWQQQHSEKENYDSFQCDNIPRPGP